MRARLALGAALVALAAGAAVAAPPDPLCKLEAGKPADAVDFMRRYPMCVHFGGEEPYDADRRREIDTAVRELRCDRLDRDEARLRRRYARSPAILGAIDRAKEEISWPDCPVPRR